MATKIWVGTDTGNEGEINTAANWSASGVPTDSDSAYFVDSAQAVTADFAQWVSSGPSPIVVDQSYSGKIAENSYLQVAAASVIIGQHVGPGSPTGSACINVDLGSTACTCQVLNTGTAADSADPAVRLKANSASTTILVNKGKVGLALAPGETTTIGTLDVAHAGNVLNDADVFVGAGVTVTTVNQRGGDLVLGCGATTVTTHAGTLLITGAGAITTLNARGANVFPESTGTITTLTASAGTVDLTRSKLPRTITTLKVNPGAVVRYDPAVVTITNAIQGDGVLEIRGV